MGVLRFTPRRRAGIQRCQPTRARGGGRDYGRALRHRRGSYLGRSFQLSAISFQWKRLLASCSWLLALSLCFSQPIFDQQSSSPLSDSRLPQWHPERRICVFRGPFWRLVRT